MVGVARGGQVDEVHSEITTQRVAIKWSIARGVKVEDEYDILKRELEVVNKEQAEQRARCTAGPTHSKTAQPLRLASLGDTRSEPRVKHIRGRAPYGSQRPQTLSRSAEEELLARLETHFEDDTKKQINVLSAFTKNHKLSLEVMDDAPEESKVIIDRTNLILKKLRDIINDGGCRAAIETSPARRVVPRCFFSARDQFTARNPRRGWQVCSRGLERFWPTRRKPTFF